MMVLAFFIMLLIFPAHSANCPTGPLEEDNLNATELGNVDCNEFSRTVCRSPYPADEVPAAVVTESEYQMSLITMHENTFKQRLDGYIAGAIDAEPNLNATQKSELGIIARDTHLIFEMEDAMKLGLNEAELNFVRSMRILSCGFKNNVPNAMAIDMDNRRLVSICPATTRSILQSTPHPRTAENLADQFAFLIGHEVGHFLYHEKKDFYKKYSKCLQKHPTHRTLEREKTHNIFKIIFGELRVGPHLKEIVADFWGHRAAGLMMNQNPRLETLYNNYRFMCKIGAKDDGEHPGLPYRIDFLARADANVTHSIRCPKISGCGL